MDPEPTSEESVPEQDAPQQRPTEPPRALLPEFLHQGGAAKQLAPDQRRQLVASGGTRGSNQSTTATPSDGQLAEDGRC